MHGSRATRRSSLRPQTRVLYSFFDFAHTRRRGSATVGIELARVYAARDDIPKTRGAHEFFIRCSMHTSVPAHLMGYDGVPAIVFMIIVLHCSDRQTIHRNYDTFVGRFLRVHSYTHTNMHDIRTRVYNIWSASVSETDYDPVLRAVAGISLRP